MEISCVLAAILFYVVLRKTFQAWCPYCRLRSIALEPVHIVLFHGHN